LFISFQYFLPNMWDSDEYIQRIRCGLVSVNRDVLAGRSPLYDAVSSSGGQQHVVKCLLQHKADVNRESEATPWRYALLCAFANSNIDIARMLIEAKASLEI